MYPASLPFEKLEEAFGPSSLGLLIVQDLPSRYIGLRHKLLSYSSYLANLPSEELDPIIILTTLKDSLSCPSARYLTGWSHGKETLKSGSYDALKGSYYVNCAFYQDPDLDSAQACSFSGFPEYTGPNVWPKEASLPGFRETFEELCTLIIDTASLVARACDRYAVAHTEDYEPGYLEHVVKTSTTTKARLLHYFPAEASSSTNTDVVPMLQGDSDEEEDSWCATHIDHGCLTGLTSALYIDEAAHSPHILNPKNPSSALQPLPFLRSPPSPSTGLYIHSRTNIKTKIFIPPSCLAFQTGEALQKITGGKFRAVPHFVRMGGPGEGGRVARNTLAVFTQPNLGEVVDRRTGQNFAEFSREVAERFG